MRMVERKAERVRARKGGEANDNQLSIINEFRANLKLVLDLNIPCKKCC